MLNFLYSLYNLNIALLLLALLSLLYLGGSWLYVCRLFMITPFEYNHLEHYWTLMFLCMLSCFVYILCLSCVIESYKIHLEFNLALIVCCMLSSSVYVLGISCMIDFPVRVNSCCFSMLCHSSYTGLLIIIIVLCWY
jgi:hypothetical protein